MNFYRQFTDVDFEDLNRGEGFEIMKKVSKEDMELIWSGNDKIDEGGIHDILKKCREEKEKKAEKPKTGEEQAGETQIQMLSRLIQQISHPDFRDRYGIPRITPGKAPATREHAMLMSAFMSEKYNPENTK
jgi:hypothetical protein